MCLFAALFSVFYKNNFLFFLDMILQREMCVRSYDVADTTVRFVCGRRCFRSAYRQVCAVQ